MSNGYVATYLLQQEATRQKSFFAINPLGPLPAFLEPVTLFRRLPVRRCQ